MASLGRISMTSWPELEPMQNNLVNYGVTDNGIAVIELSSDSSGEPWKEGKTSVNTYTHAMMRDIDEAVLRARFDDDVTVIVLTGHGEKFFSAGASISMLDSVTPGFKYFFCLHANETLSRFEQTPKLVIAALNGHAVGGGLEIAMSADIRIARKDSGQVGLPEVSLGVLAGTGGTAAPLPESVIPVKVMVKLAGLRGVIARRMTESSTIPAVTLSTKADVTDSVAFQRSLVGEWRQYRLRPQYQDLVIAAVARALKETPKANAHLVGDEIRILDEINVGVAMAVTDGLLVPVIKNADKKSLLEIAQEVRDLAKKAKSNTLSIDEMTNSTFSITNLSSYNIDEFNPLLNPPEIGILGVGTVEDAAVVVDGEIAVRSIANLNLAFDHRAWDGAPAAEFVRQIAKFLSDPSWMKA